MTNSASDLDGFIARWRGVAELPDSTELATAQSFVTELCALLGVESLSALGRLKLENRDNRTVLRG